MLLHDGLHGHEQGQTDSERYAASPAVEVQQKTYSVQILHLAAVERSGRQTAGYGPRHPGWMQGCGPELALRHSEGTIKDALDNLCNLAGLVGTGNGNLLYRLGPDPHPAGGCLGSHGNPPDSGTQSRLVALLSTSGE